MAGMSRVPSVNALNIYLWNHFSCCCISLVLSVVIILEHFQPSFCLVPLFLWAPDKVHCIHWILLVFQINVPRWRMKESVLEMFLASTLISPPSDACCSRTEVVEGTQTISWPRRAASEHVADPAVLWYMQFNFTVNISSDITFTRSLGISFIQLLLLRLVMKIANSPCKSLTIIVSGGFKPRKPICNLPINRGSCQAKLRRFYFDSADETCKLFVFGGCQGERAGAGRETVQLTTALLHSAHCNNHQ